VQRGIVLAALVVSSLVPHYLPKKKISGSVMANIQKLQLSSNIKISNEQLLKSEAQHHTSNCEVTTAKGLNEK
jgi:hypothetical protein